LQSLLANAPARLTRPEILQAWPAGHVSPSTQTL